MEKPDKKNIIIVGAGFGGITAARYIGKKIGHLKKFSIILIDKNPYQLYTPALYEIAAIPVELATAPILKSCVTIPIQEIIRGTHIQFIRGEVMGLNTVEKTISLKTGESILFEYLVLALGAETNFFGIPGMKEYAYPLKKFEDALAIRNRIEMLLAEKEHLQIVVGGGGATGVEVSAELANFICTLQKKIRPATMQCGTKLVLVEGAPQILPGFDSPTVALAEKKLSQLGVRIITSFGISEITPQKIKSKNGTDLAYDIFIWTGGVAPGEQIKQFNLPLTAKGTFAVNEFLLAGERIFAIGDNAGFIDTRTGKFLPGIAAVAEAEAYLTAQNIERLIEKKEIFPFKPLRMYPYILTLGKKHAIANLVFIRFSGFWGWCAKIFVELRYLLFALRGPHALRIWIQHIKLYSAND